MEGYPQPRSGWEYPQCTPHPRLDRVLPIQDWMGYPPYPGRDTVSLCLGLDGVPPPRPRLDAVPPTPIQGWMLRGGRCASCVHAGELSCLDFFLLHLSSKVKYSLHSAFFSLLFCQNHVTASKRHNRGFCSQHKSDISVQYWHREVLKKSAKTKLLHRELNSKLV